MARRKSRRIWAMQDSHLSKVSSVISVMHVCVTGESEEETDDDDEDDEDIAGDTADDAVVVVVVLVTLDVPVAHFPWTLFVESDGSSTVTDRGEVDTTSRVDSL